eukprot:89079-Chlamydomonas_euryale.AAC.1
MGEGARCAASYRTFERTGARSKWEEVGGANAAAAAAAPRPAPQAAARAVGGMCVEAAVAVERVGVAAARRGHMERGRGWGAGEHAGMHAIMVSS